MSFSLFCLVHCLERLLLFISSVLVYCQKCCFIYTLHVCGNDLAVCELFSLILSAERQKGLTTCHLHPHFRSSCLYVAFYVAFCLYVGRLQTIYTGIFWHIKHLGHYFGKNAWCIWIFSQYWFSVSYARHHLKYTMHTGHGWTKISAQSVS